MTEQHVSSAGALLTDAVRIDDRDPMAAERLRTLATQFSILDTDVRSRPAPVVTEEAHTLLANTFAAYAEAFGLAASGIDDANDEVLAQAITRIEEANTDYAVAMDLVADVADNCGLDASGLPLT
jgi:hypothetical protein